MAGAPRAVALLPGQTALIGAALAGLSDGGETFHAAIDAARRRAAAPRRARALCPLRCDAAAAAGGWRGRGAAPLPAARLFAAARMPASRLLTP